MRGSLFDHAIHILLFLMLLGTLLNKGQPKNIANCQNKGYSDIRLCNLFRYLICVDVNLSYDIRKYFIKSVFCPQNQEKFQKVFIRYKINQYIYVYTKIMAKYICIIGNIYGLYSTCSAVRKNQLLAQYTGLYIPPPPRNHVTGARQHATNESSTCSRLGVKQQQQHAREGGGAVYTASSLTSRVNSVRCTETWLFSTLVLEKSARILLGLSCIAVSLYFIKDITTAASAEKALPKHPMLFSCSGTNVYGLRSFACVLSLPTKELLTKDIRGKSIQYIEIISVPNCAIKMSDPTPPREENSHGKPSQYVGCSHTHFHFLCPTVLVILLISQYINACY